MPRPLELPVLVLKRGLNCTSTTVRGFEMRTGAHHAVELLLCQALAGERENAVHQQIDLAWLHVQLQDADDTVAELLFTDSGVERAVGHHTEQVQGHEALRVQLVSEHLEDLVRFTLGVLPLRHLLVRLVERVCDFREPHRPLAGVQLAFVVLRSHFADKLVVLHGSVCILIQIPHQTQQLMLREDDVQVAADLIQLFDGDASVVVHIHRPKRVRELAEPV
mmetsp:Transcript_30639/g.51785  ORF Transcript_30639/g.51785 Transcript_30639/m.51785 type:complete len:221 (+) Transcript_30639:706-1368(+)